MRHDPRTPATRWFRTWLWRPVLVLLIAGGLGWWMLSLPGRSRPEHVPVAAPPEHVSVPPPAEPPWRPRATVEPAPGCKPEADRRCLDGDAMQTFTIEPFDGARWEDNVDKIR